MDTPILLIIFNRPEVTAHLLKALEAVRPTRLFVTADGPRVDRAGEAERCQATRALIDAIPWPCTIEKLYSEKNLGCGMRLSSAISWFLTCNPEGIILEDDCVPHPDFFPFCTELLARFRDDERVMAISGTNFQNGQRRTAYSYYYSQLIEILGWATWARAWKHFDIEMKSWPDAKEHGLIESLFREERAQRHWNGRLSSMATGRRDAWSYAWRYACYAQRGLCVLPEGNLVSNIGDGPDSTHRQNAGDTPILRLPFEPVEFPLKHPPHVIVNRAAEKHSHDVQRPARWRRLFRKYFGR